MSILFFSIYKEVLYEHHAHNRLKHDAHITPVEGGVVTSLMGVQNMQNHFIIVPSLAKLLLRIL